MTVTQIVLLALIVALVYFVRNLRRLASIRNQEAIETVPQESRVEARVSLFEPEPPSKDPWSTAEVSSPVDRDSVIPPSEPVPRPRFQAREIRLVMRDSESIRQAMIIRELLDKPVALRRASVARRVRR